MALKGLAGSASAAGMAVKGLAAGMATWGVMKIYQAIQAFRDMRDAQKEAAETAKQSAEFTGDLLSKYEKFKDIEIPDDITEMAQQDLEEFEKKLRKARAYYRVLVADLEQKAGEKTIFGTFTDEAQEAQKKLKDTRSRLDEIEGALEKVKSAAPDTADAMEKPAKAVMATSEQLKEFEKQARKAYEHARSQAEKYAEEVLKWEEKIKNARMSTQDKIRELQRKGLSEQEQWNDKRLQADEKMMAARQALREKDYERAKKLADQAQSLYADLATEVTAEKDGEDVVVKSIRETKKVAVEGVKEAGKFVEQLYQTQKQSAEKSRAEWEAAADKIEERLNEVSRARETDVKIELPNLASVQSEINNLVRDETKHITVVVTRKVKTEEQKAAGGLAGLAVGGQLPGFGGGDRIRALLEAGEFVIRKEAVRKYGAAFFEALNSMRLPKMQAPAMKFAAGGAVPSAGEVMTLNLRAGNAEASFPVLSSRRSARDQVREIDAELKKMGLARG